MRVSDQFFTTLESYEGFVSCPYKDQGGKPTIGIGTITYPTGVAVRMTDTCISHDTALAYAKSFMAGIEEELDAMLHCDINQNQYDSLADFAYNLGTGALKNSTLLRKLKANPSDPSIRTEFLRWVNVKGKPDKGLVTRRTKEANLYFTPVT